jgi:cell envelope-related function transcriptional attenuator common domain
MSKPMKLKRTSSRSALKSRRKKRWGIATAAVAAAVGISVLCYLRTMQRPEKYVDTWKEAESAAESGSKDSEPAASSSRAGNTGLASLNADDFYRVQQKDYPIIQVRQKDPSIENILIMGIDGGDMGAVGQNRADCMMIASVNTKNNTLSLTSLMRDTKTYFPNTRSWHKLNAAYSYGGPGLQIDIINYAYKLDIQKYIQVDFEGFQRIIDIVNGVPVTLSAREASYSSIDAGKKGGRYTLSGAQALGYVRTREIDDDFMRTQRQRNVLQSLYTKFKGASMRQKLEVATQCIGSVKTNIPTGTLLGSLLSFESDMDGNIRQLEVPSEGDGLYTTQRYPIFYWNLNWSGEDKKLRDFIYGK